VRQKGKEEEKRVQEREKRKRDKDRILLVQRDEFLSF